jgi:hypothetical protein
MFLLGYQSGNHLGKQARSEGENYVLYYIAQFKENVRAGGVVQAVEHLLCKCKALSSKPQSHKKKNSLRRM